MTAAVKIVVDRIVVKWIDVLGALRFDRLVQKEQRLARSMSMDERLYGTQNTAGPTHQPAPLR